MPVEPDQLLKARQARDAAHVSLQAASRELRAADERLKAAERAGDRRAAELRREREDQAREEASLRERVGGLRADARGLLNEWITVGPQDRLAQLADVNPFVLLPVRLETRFVRSQARGAELLVRIFPDDISVASPPAPLTDGERSAGEAYWTARLAALKTPGDAALNRTYVGAWEFIATRSGGYRAGYIVRQTQPANWDAVAAAPDTVAPLPATPEPDLAPAIARAHCLPDRFVVMTISGRDVINTVSGSAVPDDLALSPHPDDATTWVTRDPATGRLRFPPELAWLLDFDEAVKVGMGMRIPLIPPWDQSGFDRVIVFGMRAATPPTDAPGELQALLARHRYNNGCGIVTNGTPTNNTESARSGWKPPATESEQLFAIEEKAPALTPTTARLGVSDGWRLSQLLGLKQEFVARLPNAQATDIAESFAMNRALMPATLGDFLRIFCQTVVNGTQARLIERFFVDHVSGRGHYPALRAGRQPYGVVVISSLGKWQHEQLRQDSTFWQQFLAQLRLHRGNWDKFIGEVPKAGEPSAAPFDRLLKIIGLLASCADFVSRKAVSDESVVNRLKWAKPAEQDAILQWQDKITKGRGGLGELGFPAPAGGLENPLIQYIAFLLEADGWRAPLVDRDPKVPLSEREPIAPYDGVSNYLDWLATVTLPTLRNQRFLDATGHSTSAPSALLYALLRHSLLTATEHGTGDVAGVAGVKFFDVVESDPLIANVGDAQHVLRKDYVQVDAAALGLASKPVALGDWVFAAARDPAGMLTAMAAPNAALAAEMVALVHTATEVSSAIGALAKVPTARLERLMCEHIDLVSYRLDAWITGLFQERLELLQVRQQQRGYYLGAYGWVENLRPNWGARQPLPADAVPAAFRGFGPIVADAQNGGYIHAPSLGQGATAAVLRNGYLSHATPTNPSPFAVNLTSARVRAATAVMEGVRNGQPIAALLGYQLERGLHEKHPGLELDQYIYVLRARFPFVSGKLTELAPGVSNEAVEARNVVNMLDLLEWYLGKTYPYDIAGLPAAGSSDANALVAEIKAAADTLDAVSDLLLSESVHQAVQGNFERTKASLQALTEPEAPPESELIRTPRSGRELSLKVTLTLDTGAMDGWQATLTPRAAANALVNHWLKAHLPAPGTIQWRVRNGAAAPAFENLGTYGLEPIDVVLLSGNSIGDRSSELERYLIRSYRAKNTVPDTVVTYIAPLTEPVAAATSLVFDFGDANGNVSLITLQPLLARLRRMITKARPAHALDWLLSTESDKADAIDPKGVSSGDALLDDFKDLRARLTAALTALKAAIAALVGDVTATQAKYDLLVGGDETVLADPGWPAALELIRKHLFDVVAFGFAEALPADGVTISRPLLDALIGQAKSVSAALDKRVKQAEALMAPNTDPASRSRTDRILLDLTEASRQIFGPSFVIVPLFKFFAAQGNEIQQAATAPVTTDALLIEEWLQGVARVRPQIADLTWTAAASSWLGTTMADPAVIQLPHEPGATWIGARLPGNVARKEWLSILNFGVAPRSAGVNATLVLDDWTETVPVEKETTGVAFHCNRPSAAAPQALLVVVPPVVRGHWQWDDLVSCLLEALDLAKLRAVEPDQLVKHGGYFQLLPAILSEFTQLRYASLDFAKHSVEALGKFEKL